LQSYNSRQHAAKACQYQQASVAPKLTTLGAIRAKPVCQSQKYLLHINRKLYSPKTGKPLTALETALSDEIVIDRYAPPTDSEG
jgi:hypothetical protein